MQIVGTTARLRLAKGPAPVRGVVVGAWFYLVVINQKYLNEVKENLETKRSGFNQLDPSIYQTLRFQCHKDSKFARYTH